MVPANGSTLLAAVRAERRALFGALIGTFLGSPDPVRSVWEAMVSTETPRDKLLACEVVFILSDAFLAAVRVGRRPRV